MVPVAHHYLKEALICFLSQTARCASNWFDVRLTLRRAFVSRSRGSARDQYDTQVQKLATNPAAPQHHKALHPSTRLGDRRFVFSDSKLHAMAGHDAHETNSRRLITE